MKLNKINTFIKDNLENFIDGKFDDKFGPDHLKMVLELSFLFNHTTTDGNYIIFKYNGIGLNINIYDSYTLGNFNEEDILYHIRNEETFKSCYNLFLRDVKLNKLLGNE
jgi:hypothetical protein